uniref:Uncharacterized protein n=1 Tax=Anguilla anguilla TaxID=7936 RepID=A0A0E9VP36_ANGAN
MEAMFVTILCHRPGHISVAFEMYLDFHLPIMTKSKFK